MYERIHADISGFGERKGGGERKNPNLPIMVANRPGLKRNHEHDAYAKNKRMKTRTQNDQTLDEVSPFCSLSKDSFPS